MSVWMITGAGTGIGRATALQLAAAGESIVVQYSRSAEAARATAAECEARGARTLVLQGDVSQDADCRRMAEQVAAHFGPALHGLVNNAGTTRFAPNGQLEAVNEEDFLAIYRVNVVGTWQMTRACAALLREGQGAVVNVSSASAFDGGGSSPAYSASKGALNTLTMSLARTLAPQVRVNSVCPGFVETDWHVRGLGQERFESVRQTVSQITALKSTLSADDVAQAILAALRLPGLTGQNLLVDSGRSLGTAPVLLQEATRR
jgi:3-oxoacyl-[acyl-carrier protein] reductase